MSGRGPAMASGQKADDFRGTAGRVLGRLLGDRTTVAWIGLLGVVGTLLSVVGPRLLGHATDLVFSGYLSDQFPQGASQAEVLQSLEARGQDRLADIVRGADVQPGQGIDFTALGWVLTAALVLYLLASALMWVQGRLTAELVQGMVRGLRVEVEATVNRLPLSYLDSHERGDLMSRTTNDVDNLAQSLQQTISQLLTSILTVVGVLVMMLTISPLLALVAVLTIPVAVLLTRAVVKRSQPQFVAQWSSTGRLNGHVEEAFTGHEIVKVFGQQKAVRAEFDRRNDALFTAAFKAQFISGVVQPLMMFVGNLNYVLVAVIGAVRVTSGSLTVGEVQAFIQYSRQFTQPLTQIASMVNLLQSGMASAERVLAFIDEPGEAADPPDAVVPRDVRGRVEFRDVSFSYSDAPLIEHLDLVAEPGQTVAIVGPTGAGKTTLTNLLMRFYPVDAGAILLDGVDIASMDRGALRRSFGVVLQDAWLFKGSIRDNIAYGGGAGPRAADEHGGGAGPVPDVRGAADEHGGGAGAVPVEVGASVVRAAEAASVDHLVQTLPDGYDTIVEEGGTGVSAGQRQLLTIARAFHADPAILVLDEATSSVDTRTEALVQEAMTRLRSGRTSFVIAHRLSTIRDADRIVVMEHGRIVEQGTHDALMAAGGAYQRLYAAQFAGTQT